MNLAEAVITSFRKRSCFPYIYCIISGNKKKDNFDPYNALLAITTIIPRLKYIVIYMEKYNLNNIIHTKNSIL
ncbi:MAG: hypothetical protein ACRCVV_02155, partial [Shewanella sp.]